MSAEEEEEEEKEEEKEEEEGGGGGRFIDKQRMNVGCKAQLAVT